MSYIPIPDIESQSGAIASVLPTTTKGDIVVHNGTDDTRLAVGTNDQVLTADSAQTNGVKWATTAAGTHTLDAGQTDVTITSPADDELLAYDNGSSEWINQTKTEAGFGTIATQDANNVAITGGSITGITDLAIADGGTGQSTQTAAFDALAPTTTKGDVVVHNGSDNIRVAVGTNDHVLTADSNEASGVKWAAAAAGGSVDRGVQMVVFGWLATVETGDGKFYFHVDALLNGMDLNAVHAEVITAGVTGTTDIQIHNVTQAADMLSTKLTIDSAETGSDTAATPAVIDTANDDVAENDLLRVDVDAIQSTVEPKGLIVTLNFS